MASCREEAGVALLDAKADGNVAGRRQLSGAFALSVKRAAGGCFVGGAPREKVSRESPIFTEHPSSS